MHLAGLSPSLFITTHTVLFYYPWCSMHLMKTKTCFSCMFVVAYLFFRKETHVLVLNSGCTSHTQNQTVLDTRRQGPTFCLSNVIEWKKTCQIISYRISLSAFMSKSSLHSIFLPLSLPRSKQISSDNPTALPRPCTPLCTSLHLRGVLCQAGQSGSKSSLLLSLTVCLPSSIPDFPPSPSPSPLSPSFHPAAPCVLSTAGQARSERQSEQSAPVMTACPSEYTFLSSPAPPPPDPSPSLSVWKAAPPQLSLLPDPPSPSRCDRTPAPFAVLSSSISCSRPAVVIFPSSPCNPVLALPSITGSSCPLSLPCICLKP